MKLAQEENNKERRYFSSLVSFYIQTVASTVVGLSLHFIQLPETPCYIYSVFGFTESQSWIRFIFVFHEAILITIVWIKACFIEMFILIFVNRILSSLIILSNCVDET